MKTMTAHSSPNQEEAQTDELHTRIASKYLLGSKNIVIIEHGDQEYKLRLTRSQKLILTK